MKTYKIIGLRDEKQARRVYKRLRDAMGESVGIELDIEHNQIKLTDDVDLHILSLISSFEQVSFIDARRIEKLTKKKGYKEKHSHSHNTGAVNPIERNMFIVFLLNFIFSLSEFFFGTIFRSQAILSDAVHDIGDALSIGLAYFFEKISSRDSSPEYSYGYRRFSLLGGLVTRVILLGGAAVMIVTTIPTLSNPRVINYQGVFWVAIGAIVINGFSVWLMSGGESSNEKLLNIHLFEDLFGWILVLVMSVVLKYTDWYILDSILSLGIAGWIIYVTFPEFLSISKIFLQAVPAEIDIEKLRHEIMTIDAVQMLSHLHIWSTDGQQHMMSLTVTTGLETNKEHERIKQAIREVILRYDISHITIEIIYDPERIIQ